MSSPTGQPMLSRTVDGRLIQVVLSQQTVIQQSASGEAGTTQISIPEANQVVMVQPGTESTMASIRPIPTNASQRPSPSLFVGDYVKITPQFATEKTQSLDAFKKLVEAVGTIQLVAGHTVVALFNGLEKRHWSCDSSKFIKLNKYSVKQVIQIRSDDHTVQEIEKQFENQSVSLQGIIGQVVGIDDKNPSSHLFVQFDNSDIYDWLPQSISLPSAWMDRVQPANPAIEEKRLKLAAEQVELFFEAVEVGDLRNAKLLHYHNGVDAASLNSEGKTALHLASQSGFIQLIHWLLDEVQVNVNQPDCRGFQAIHYAVLGCKPVVLQLLLEKGANVLSQTYERAQTALHIAVTNKCAECLVVLMKFKADANLQDEEGNTPLHVAIENGSYGILRTMLPMYSTPTTFNWGLRNNKGLNVIHQAAIKNDFTTMEFILNLDDVAVSDHLLDRMTDNLSSTVLHYVCTTKNYKMAKLLVDKTKDWIMPDDFPLWGKLLGARNRSGSTALLIASNNKDYAMVELLVESGADVQAADRDGNTVIHLVASSPAPDKIPHEEDSPAVFKFYEIAMLGDNANSKAMMQSHPIMSLLAYFVDQGSLLEAINKSGKSGSDAVATKGSRVIIYKLLVQLLIKQGGCMGNSDCAQQPAFRLHCPHKEDYKVCANCFLLTAQKMKCKCPEEQAVSIQNTSILKLLDLLSSSVGVPAAVNNQEDLSSSYDFKFFKSAGIKNGFLEDQMENKYEHFVTRRVDYFRCNRESDSAGKCQAVARRFKKDEKWTIHLESPHNHPAALKRKPEEGNSGQPPAKKP